MNPSYVGAVWMFGGNFAPAGFHFCDGSLQSIAENPALFNLLGTTFGGDGIQTFGLPDLRGRVALSQGQGLGLSNYALGQMSGTETITLNSSNMPSHTHLLNAGTSASSQTPGSTLYINTVMANNVATNFFSDTAPNATLIGGTIGSAGGNIPFNIIQPVLAVSYIISLYGIYPSQN